MELLIKEAPKGDMGKGIVRINKDLMKKLDLNSGDTIKLINPKKHKLAGATVIATKEKSNIICVDLTLRRNLGAYIGDKVLIDKTDVILAQSITLAPIGNSIRLNNYSFLLERLINRLVSKNNIFSFYSRARKIDLIVENYTPDVEVAKIHQETEIIISKLYHKKYLENVELIKKLKAVMNEHSQIELERLRKIVNLGQAEFDRKIFEWAQEFNFKIDGDLLIFKRDMMIEFINMLEKKFYEWQIKEAIKFKKLNGK